jgi:translation initiation factor 2B subunit (eIF-2B alpha/beta/delta family)
MASIWNAALALVGEARRPGALDRFEATRRAAAGALARAVADALRLPGGGPLHVVTLSFSGSVLAGLIETARRERSLLVSCAEGRPALEGRRLAAALAGAGIPVDLYTDAALGGALGRHPDARTAVLVGADAVAPGWTINKSGTAMLAAAAARERVPVMVAASRDKFVDARTARLLAIVEHDGREVWPEAPPGVTVLNRWFEYVPVDLVEAVVTEAGGLPPDRLGDACRVAAADVSDEDVRALLG